MGARKIWASWSALCLRQSSQLNCAPAPMLAGVLLIAGVAFSVIDWPLAEKIILAALGIVALGLVSLIVFGLHKAGFWRLCGRLAVMAWTACPVGRPALHVSEHPVPADGSLVVGEYADGSPVTWKPEAMRSDAVSFQTVVQPEPVDRAAVAASLAEAAGFGEDNAALPACVREDCQAVWDGTCWHLPQGAPALHGYAEHSLDPATLPRRVPRDADKWGGNTDLLKQAEHVLGGRAL